MKKIFGLLLVLVLVMGTTAMVFAEEAELTLEEQITVLEETINGLEEYLLTEELTEEEIEVATNDLLGSETKLEVLNAELEEKVKLGVIASIEAKLLITEDELAVLESVDKSEFTEEELLSHQEALDALNANYITLSEEYTALTEVEEINPIVELEDAMIALEEQLLDETLTEEEKAAIQAEMVALEEELEALNKLIEEEVEAAKTALEEEIDTLKEMLDDESLTEEEIDNIMSQIETLATELDALKEKSDNPNEERFEMAEELNISPGKMNLLQKLQSESDMEDFLFEDWSDKSVKDIMQEIKNYRKVSQEKTVAEEVKIKNNGKGKGKKK